MEKGATHYTHWFQPLTGSTAEKHDSFYGPDGDGNDRPQPRARQAVLLRAAAAQTVGAPNRARREARDQEVCVAESEGLAPSEGLTPPDAARFPHAASRTGNRRSAQLTAAPAANVKR